MHYDPKIFLLSKCLGKKMYRTYGIAIAAVDRVWFKYQKETRVYQCPECTGYHLTSNL